MNNDKTTNQLLPFIFHHFHHVFCNLLASVWWESQENNTDGFLTMRMDQLTKVLIFRQQDSVFAYRKANNLRILRSRCGLRSEKDIVS